MKRRIIKVGLLLILIFSGLFAWRFYIIEPDSISFHNDLTLSTDKKEYNIGDSIFLNVTIKATDDKGLVRLFDDYSNQQISVRKAIKGDISSSEWGTFYNEPYRSKSRFLFYNWTTYDLQYGQEIQTKLIGKIYFDQSNKVIIDFGKHGKYKSEFYDEYAIEVSIFELFPDLNFLIDLDYFVPSTNFVYIKLKYNNSDISGTTFFDTDKSTNR